MFDLVTYGGEKIQLFLLLMMRTGGLLMTAPFFSNRAIPSRIGVAMTLGLSMVLMPIFINTALPVTHDLADLVILCAKEVLLGVLIGFVFNVVFIGIRLAGAIVGYQIGFSMVNVIDPNSSDASPILGEFWFLLGTLFFLIINGHHVIISGLVDSFRVIPLGLATPSGAVGEWVMKYSSLVFVLGVKFSAPVIITVFLVDVAMGVLARTMPQMNIFIVGFPLKIFVGLLMIGISLPMFSYVLEKVCLNLDNEMAYLMRLYHVSGTI